MSANPFLNNASDARLKSITRSQEATMNTNTSTNTNTTTVPAKLAGIEHEREFVGALVPDHTESKSPTRLQMTKRRATRRPWRTSATAAEMVRQENRRRMQVNADYLSECQAAYADFEALRIDHDAYRARVREARRLRDMRLV